MKNEIENEIIESYTSIKDTISLIDTIELAIIKIIDCLSNHRKVVIFGNGGSAADAQHIAAELIGRFHTNRKSLPAIALTTDSSILTSIANDFSFDVVFSRQCESLVSKGDVVIGISTSGNSKNVYNGLETSKKLGAITIGLLGNDGGNIKNISDISLIVSSTSTPRIQEVHRVIYHIICNHVEKYFASKNE